MNNYTFDDLVKAYKALGLKRGDTISLKTGLRSLGILLTTDCDALDLHVRALNEVIDLNVGTLVVASTSTNLCGTQTPFSPSTTPGMMGALTERIRKSSDALRSFHAFESYSALGGRAKELFSGLTRYAYGIDTPECRLLEANAKCVSIGLPSHITCSIVHHIEMIAGVPYRYIREYHHPVEFHDGTLKLEVFYRHPWYQDSDVKKSYPRLFNTIKKMGFTIDSINVGQGNIEVYSLQSFSKYATKALQNDVYAVLKHEPRIKPWEH